MSRIVEALRRVGPLDPTGPVQAAAPAEAATSAPSHGDASGSMAAAASGMRSPRARGSLASVQRRIQAAGSLAELLGVSREQREHCRKLLEQIERAGQAGRVIALTSARRGDGKTSLALQLACVAPRPSRPFLLIDANLERPRLAARLHLPGEPGLTELVLQGRVPSEAVRTLAGLGCDLLPSGRPVPDARSVLLSGRLPRLLGQLKKAYSLILVETPSLEAGWAAEAIAAWCDAAVLVARIGATPVRSLETAARSLADRAVPVLGCILSCSRTEWRPPALAEAA